MSVKLKHFNLKTCVCVCGGGAVLFLLRPSLFDLLIVYIWDNKGFIKFRLPVLQFFQNESLYFRVMF